MIDYAQLWEYELRKVWNSEGEKSADNKETDMNEPVGISYRLRENQKKYAWTVYSDETVVHKQEW